MKSRVVAPLVPIAILAAISYSTTFAPASMRGAPQCFGQDATIVGTPASESIRGTTGPDVIVGGGSGAGGTGDEIIGLAGDDLICADPSGPGDTQESVIHGGRGNDRIRSAGDLFGGPGDDTLTDPEARGNVVHLVGGEGDDLMRSQAQDISFFIPGPGHDLMVGARGAWNVVKYRSADRGVVVDLRSGTAHGQGHDLLERINFVFGSEHADVLRGNAAFGVLVGFGGDDALSGRGGLDLIRGGDEDDRVDGGSGNDRLWGDPGIDILFGRSGNDRLVEKNLREPNVILGGPGRDTCRGGYRVPPNVQRGCESD